MKSLAKGSNCVKWSQYTTLKISNTNTHQTKVSAHFIFFPVCEYSVVHSTAEQVLIYLFSTKTKKMSEMFASECQVWGGGGLWGNWLWSSVSLLRVLTVSDWARFAVQISKDEAPTPLLTVGLLFIFGHLSCIHLTTLKIHSVSQTSQNFEQKTSPEVINNSGNKVTSLATRLQVSLRC